MEKIASICKNVKKKVQNKHLKEVIFQKICYLCKRFGKNLKKHAQ